MSYSYLCQNLGNVIAKGGRVAELARAAITAIEYSQFKQAFEFVSQAYEIGPEEPVLHIMAAGSLCAMDMFPEAITAVTTALKFEKRPDMRALLYGYRSAMHCSNQNATAAIKDINQAVAADKNGPQYVNLMRRRAMLSVEVNDLNRAVHEIAEYLAHVPDDDHVHLVHARIIGTMGRYDDAAKKYDEMMVRQPKNLDLIQEYALLLIQAKDYAEARKLYLHLAELNPRNKDLWLHNANILSEQIREQETAGTGGISHQKPVQQKSSPKKSPAAPPEKGDDGIRFTIPVDSNIHH